MKPYTVIREIWRKGILNPVGTVLHMAEEEAKYLAHPLGEAPESSRWSRTVKRSARQGYSADGVVTGGARR
jgi:hypothetical protein